MQEALKLVVIVADDTDTRRKVREALAAVPIELEELAGSQELLRLAEKRTPSLFVVDLVLSDMTGLGLCRLVREQPGLERVPVMLLSSHAMEPDRIVAFEAGVDDFMAKPFFARELAARVKAILRRVEARASQRPHGALRLDPHTTAVEVDGKRVGLTPREFDILAALARSGGRVLNREEIIRQVWRSKIVDPRVVDAHVKAIRRKLGAAHHLLETVRGVGFRVASDERWGSGPVAWPGPVSCSTGGESG